MKITLLASLMAGGLPCAAQPPVSTTAASPPAAAALPWQSVDAIGKHFAAKKAEAYEAFLAAKPGADDALLVMRQLNFCYHELGDTGRELAMLERQYAAIPKGSEDHQGLAFENIFARFSIHRGNNSVAVLDKAFAVIEQGKKDFPGFAESPEGPLLDSLVAKLKLHNIGSPVEIAFTALDGTKVDLAAMKGKVVLVIYVAPSPDDDDAGMLKRVKAAYDNLHGKGFEVIGLSLEKDRAALESFVKKEGIRWPQAFDSQGWDYAMAVKLTVNTRPFNFLVGKDGKMAARHMRGDELEAKVMELLK